ncbi:hypothetical protein ACFQY5_13630 [Paeniroseomonas aquatica]|uniref:hypothetical protein n=1 Tax=Paeniroseomonas aquatica TaxID=373043 RepID=UPI00360DDB94
MTRISLGVLLLAGCLARPAAAHMVWLERSGPTVQMYFGEPGENVRERGGATLDVIATPKLVGAAAPASRQADHVAFGPLPGAMPGWPRKAWRRARTASAAAGPARSSWPARAAARPAARSTWSWCRRRRAGRLSPCCSAARRSRAPRWS